MQPGLHGGFQAGVRAWLKTGKLENEKRQTGERENKRGERGRTGEERGYLYCTLPVVLFLMDSHSWMIDLLLSSIVATFFYTL